VSAFFEAIGIKPGNAAALREFSRESGIPRDRLLFYAEHGSLPSGRDLEAITRTTGVDEWELMLKMGRLDAALLQALRERAPEVRNLLGAAPPSAQRSERLEPVFRTDLGRLYQSDCLSFLCSLDSDSVDLVFADPPFNLNKLYPSGIDDNLKTEQYVAWCQAWLAECIRVLAPGGSLFLWNLPRWNSALAGYLNNRLTFRHWIAVDIKYSLPVQGRLYPSHYSLLYYCKGPKPKTFAPDRLPMQVCPECVVDLKDYGGYKDKMNPEGVSLTDVWYDIQPVRHTKYKKRTGANELSIRLLDRVIEMASRPGDLVLDPFGGSGTTYAAAEMKGRRWLGTEIGPVEDIARRLENLADERLYLATIRRGYNYLFTPATRAKRKLRGLWTDDSVRKPELPVAEKLEWEPGTEQRLLQLRERARRPYGTPLQTAEESVESADQPRKRQSGS
jgi:site-specific DNA-methyltransferase (adenine-specific)